MGKFIMEQIMGMKWLNDIIGTLLSKTGINMNGRLAGCLQFFLFDVIKITILLCVLIYLISYKHILLCIIINRDGNIHIFYRLYYRS